MGENAEKELQAAREAAAKAQKEHEEKQARKAELEKKKEELERQRIELLERQKVEREKLVEKIRRAKEKQDRLQKATSEEQNGAEKTRGENFSVKDVNGSEGGDRKAQLEKMLKDLQYQVISLRSLLIPGKCIEYSPFRIRSQYLSQRYPYSTCVPRRAPLPCSWFLSCSRQRRKTDSIALPRSTSQSCYSTGNFGHGK